MRLASSLLLVTLGSGCFTVAGAALGGGRERKPAGVATGMLAGLAVDVVLFTLAAQAVADFELFPGDEPLLDGPLLPDLLGRER